LNPDLLEHPLGTTIFFVDIENMTEEMEREIVKFLNNKGYKAEAILPTIEEKTPSFPKNIADLDEMSGRVLSGGKELTSDHPGFTDSKYKSRRQEIADIALKYKYGDKIPDIKYDEQEINTWKTVYTTLTELYPNLACKQFNLMFPLLIEKCGYGPNNIPQLSKISKFLHERTGFTLRPVAGLLSARDFLNGLAFRVFHSTQYVRHHSQPFYTPEPDVCHELLGHVPLFCDPDFADFSHELGLASLGASESDINKLSSCYWFTVEFGMCKENEQRKAYGAGLLSSFGELQYCHGLDVDSKPVYQDFDPFVVATQYAKADYPITKYQPIYFVAESFQAAKERMIQFASATKRPFTVRYNSLTQSVETLNNKYQFSSMIKEMQAQLHTLNSAIQKMAM